MVWTLVVVTICVLVFGVALVASNSRTVKTLLLISRISPYEQPGGGAGSIFVIGDSTGYGTGAKRAADSVAGRLGNTFTWYRIQNDSVNGRKIAEAQTVAESLRERYDLVVLQVGANDLLADREVNLVVNDMRALIETVRRHATSTVIITAGNIGAAPAFSGDKADHLDRVSREYTAMMYSLADEYPDVTFVALYEERDVDPFALEPERYMAKDGLHPSSAGYGVWFEKALPYFKTVLKAQ